MRNFFHNHIQNMHQRLNDIVFVSPFFFPFPPIEHDKSNKRKKNILIPAAWREGMRVFHEGDSIRSALEFILALLEQPSTFFISGRLAGRQMFGGPHNAPIVRLISDELVFGEKLRLGFSVTGSVGGQRNEISCIFSKKKRAMGLVNRTGSSGLEFVFVWCWFAHPGS